MTRMRADVDAVFASGAELATSFFILRTSEFDIEARRLGWRLTGPLHVHLFAGDRRGAYSPATRVSEAEHSTLVSDRLRARAALTTFKTLKTDSGPGL